MSEIKIIEEDGKTYKINMKRCGVKVQSKNKNWYYTKQVGPKVLTEKKRCAEKQKKLISDKTENKFKKKEDLLKKKKSAAEKKRKVDAATQKKKMVAPEKKRKVDAATQKKKMDAAEKKKKMDAVEKRKKAKNKKTGKPSTLPKKEGDTVMTKFKKEEKRLVKQFKKFLETAEECDSSEYADTLEKCFDKFLLPVFKQYEKANKLFDKDVDGLPVIVSEATEYMEAIEKCAKSRRQKCKITDDNEALSNIDIDIEELARAYFDNAMEKYIDKESKKNFTIKDQIENAVTQVADNPLPSVKLVGERLGDTFAAEYRRDLERLQDSPIDAYQFEPKFLKSKLMNKKTILKKIGIIDMMANSSPEEFIEFIENEKYDKKMKKKKEKLIKKLSKLS